MFYWVLVFFNRRFTEPDSSEIFIVGLFQGFYRDYAVKILNF